MCLRDMLKGGAGEKTKSNRCHNRAQYTYWDYLS